MAFNGWQQTSLGEETELLTGFPFKSALYSASESDIRLVRGDNVVQGQFRWEDVKRWPASQVDGLSDYFLKSGDVIVAMDRPWIEAGLKYAGVSDHDLPCLLVQRVARLRARETLDHGFLRYVIGSAEFTNHVLGVQTGTAVPHISSRQIQEFRFLRPPLSEQHAIAHILGTLDDKIELNRRMNETLEAFARAIFKSWFVDFDPVRAKMAGRQPAGMDAETAALFPGEFEDSALEQIPKGWKVQTVEEIAARIAMGPFGSRITRDNFVPNGVPVIRGNNLVNGFIDADFVFLTDAKADELKSANAHAEDIVFTHRGTLGQVGIIPVSAKFPRYIVSQSQMLVSVNNALVSPRLVYEFFRSDRGQSDLLANTSTTGVPAISRPTTSLKAIRLIVAPRDISDRFDSLTESMYLRQECNAQENEALVALRDTLLPKLLSGEVRIEALSG